MLVFPLLLAEDLHDPRRAQRLLGGGHRRALRRFHLPPGGAHPSPIEERQKEHERGHDQGDQRELPVEARHDHDHPPERQEGRDERDEAVRGEGAERGGVVLDAVRRIDRAFRVVVRGRQALQLAEQSDPHVEGHPVPDSVRQPDVRKILQIGQDRPRDEDAECEGDHRARRDRGGIAAQEAEVARERLRQDHVVQDEFDRQRRDQGQRDRREGHEE